MFKRILVPIDLAATELVKPTIETAVSLARVHESHVRLLHVLPLMPATTAQYLPPDFALQQRRAAEEALAIMARETGLEAGRITCAVLQGTAYHEVLEEAKACDADLIVMASHRPGATTYVLGSNAGNVVRYAKCSVLVVRK